MTTLNPRLLVRQHMTDADEEWVQTLHRMREVLFEFETTLDPADEEDRPILKQVPAILEQLEFAMQRGWKWEESKDYHTWWYRLTNCSCPKMDNDDCMGVSRSILSMSCPLHGRDQ